MNSAVLNKKTYPGDHVQYIEDLTELYLRLILLKSLLVQRRSALRLRAPPYRLHKSALPTRMV
jgi:hypothetical protein